MRIGIDGRFIQDHYPGIGRYTYQLALALATRFTQDEFYILASSNAANSRYDLGSLSGLANVCLVPIAALPSSAANLFFMHKTFARLQLDLVHIPHFQMPLNLPCRAVSTLHDLTPWLVPRSMPSLPARIAFMLLMRAAAGRSAHIISGSQCAAQDLHRFLGIAPDKVTVVPHGVESSFHPLDDTQVSAMRERLGLVCPYLLYCGSNKPHKNIGRLIEAWAALPKTLRATHALVFAGAEDARYPTSQELAKLNGIQASIISLGECRSSDLTAVYSGALGFVFPSLYEGFGLPVLEAMACGVPVACAGNSALTELAGNAALYFDASDSKQIGAAMTRLLSENALRKELGSAGLKRAGLFSWENTADKTMSVYRKVMCSPIRQCNYAHPACI
ncbi:MAG: glycosyltransferase family 4 protein [Chloroflexi bacterium]|nr:glycosyltransferase family 4 protein [Chloroflexota bacterium]